MKRKVEIWTTFLTNGEDEFELTPGLPDYLGGLYSKLPDGMVLGRDNYGNLFLNGKRVKYEQRCTTIEPIGQLEWTE